MDSHDLSPVMLSKTPSSMYLESLQKKNPKKPLLHHTRTTGQGPPHISLAPSRGTCRSGTGASSSILQTGFGESRLLLPFFVREPGANFRFRGATFSAQAKRHLPSGEPAGFQPQEPVLRLLRKKKNAKKTAKDAANLHSGNAFTWNTPVTLGCQKCTTGRAARLLERVLSESWKSSCSCLVLQTFALEHVTQTLVPPEVYAS